MKKILSLSLLGLMVTVSAFAAATTNRNPIPAPAANAILLTSERGTGPIDDPIRVYKLVRFAGVLPNAGVVSGDAVIYDIVSDDGVSVNLTTVSGDGAFAGIAVTAIGTADSGSTSAMDDYGHKNWGWICVHGPALANITAGGTNGNSAGDAFITSTDSGKVTSVQSNFGTDQGASKRMAKGGFFFNAASASATQAVVFVENE